MDILYKQYSPLHQSPAGHFIFLIILKNVQGISFRSSLCGNRRWSCDAGPSSGIPVNCCLLKQKKLRKLLFTIWNEQLEVLSIEMECAIKNIPDEDLAREEVAQKGTIILKIYSHSHIAFWGKQNKINNWRMSNYKALVCAPSTSAICGRLDKV